MSERHSVQPKQLPPWWVLLRDVLAFLGGWALIFHEVARPEVRESVLVLAAGVVGLPIAAVGAQTVAEAVTAHRNGTAGSLPSPQAEAPSPPSQSSS